MQPDYLIITNLFRDSMRRNAHTEYITDLLTKYIPRDTKLILNADDLISSRVSPENDRVTFGIAPLGGEPRERDSIVCDARVCPECDAVLIYEFKRYNHIGRAHCPACDFASPEPDYRIASVDFETMTAAIEEKGEEHLYKLNSKLVYNMYNYLAVTAALRQLNFGHEAISSAMQKSSIVASRFRQDTINGKTLSAIMAKGLNAVACSRYYDVVQIVTAGVRSADSLLRLLIAGVPIEKITAVQDEKEAGDAVDLASCDKIFVLYELYRYESAVKTRNRIAERIREETA